MASSFRERLIPVEKRSDFRSRIIPLKSDDEPDREREFQNAGRNAANFVAGAVHAGGGFLLESPHAATAEVLAQEKEFNAEHPEFSALYKPEVASKAAERLLENFPTQAKLEKLAEEKLGIPLQSKSPENEKYRLAGALAPAVIDAAPSVAKLALREPAALRNLLAESEPVAAAISPKSQAARYPENIHGPGFKTTPQKAREVATGTQEKLGILEAQQPQTLSLEGRVSPSSASQTKGLTVPEQKTTLSLDDRIGNLISPEKVRNSTIGGKITSERIRENDAAKYQKVNEKFAEQRQAAQQVEDIHPELVEKNLVRIRELETVPDLSGPQKELLSGLKKVNARLAAFGPNGEVSGYRPVSNQILLDQAKSWGQKVDFDFAHGNPTGVYKPSIRDFKDAALRSAEVKNPRAAELQKEADLEYADWAETFNNDYIRPFRDKTNKDYSKLYNRTLDLDEFNIIKNALVRSKEGDVLQRAILRDLVDKKIGKLLKSPKELSTRELDGALTELEAVLPEGQIQEIHTLAREAQRPPKFSAEEYRDLKLRIIDFVGDAVDLALSGNRAETLKKIAGHHAKTSVTKGLEKSDRVIKDRGRE